MLFHTMLFTFYRYFELTITWDDLKDGISVIDTRSNPKLVTHYMFGAVYTCTTTLVHPQVGTDGESVKFKIQCKEKWPLDIDLLVHKQ